MFRALYNLFLLGWVVFVTPPLADYAWTWWKIVFFDYQP